MLPPTQCIREFYANKLELTVPAASNGKSPDLFGRAYLGSGFR